MTPVDGQDAQKQKGPSINLLQVPAGGRLISGNYSGLTPMHEQSPSSSKKNLSADEKSFCDNSNNDNISMKGGHSPFVADDHSAQATHAKGQLKSKDHGNTIKNLNNPEKPDDFIYSTPGLAAEYDQDKMMKKSASLHANLTDFNQKAWPPIGMADKEELDNQGTKSDADLSDNKSF